MKIYFKQVFSNFYWFFSYLRYKIFIGFALSIFVGLLDGFGLAMFLPLLQMVSGEETVSSEGMGNLSFLIDFFEKRGVNIQLGNLLLFMILFFSLKGFILYLSRVYLVVLQQELIRKIRLTMLSDLNSLNFKFFVTTDAGRIQNTMTGEVDRIQIAYQSYFQAFEQITLVAVYIGFAFFVDYQFAILVTIGGAATNFLYKLVYTNTKGASKKLTDDSNTYQGKVIQHILNYKYLRATGSIDVFSKKLESVIVKIEKSRKKIGELNGLLEAAREPLLIIVVALVIFIQINLLDGNLGPILISLLFFYRALSALTLMQNSWNRFLGVSGSMNNLQDFQSTLKQNQEKMGKVYFEALQKCIQLDKVGFSYGESKILQNINLNIRKNQSIAFVGESGSGKTTLVNLLCGLLPPSQGQILVDGTPLKELNRTAFQNRIGYITQEPVIFNDSIFNNVTFWAERTPESEQKCITALEKASVYQFVSEQPNNLDTALGNNGINLSGGQKQRISIARELYKDIDILIMDEATSALDSETEKMIQENIDALKGQYTILIVAHRLSTIKNADSIVLMDNGSVKDQGSFEVLLERVPRFRKMVELQEI